MSHATPNGRREERPKPNPNAAYIPPHMRNTSGVSLTKQAMENESAKRNIDFSRNRPPKKFSANRWHRRQRIPLYQLYVSLWWIDEVDREGNRQRNTSGVESLLKNLSVQPFSGHIKQQQEEENSSCNQEALNKEIELMVGLDWSDWDDPEDDQCIKVHLCIAFN